VSDGWLFRLLDRLPEPWGMVVACVLYIGIVVGGFVLVLAVIGVFGAE
jgi:Ni/Fe-hydrogenase subunit HybB-like protein